MKYAKARNINITNSLGLLAGQKDRAAQRHLLEGTGAIALNALGIRALGIPIDALSRPFPNSSVLRPQSAFD
jgi:hypothetical protein